jgi:hypothetical protein
LQEELAKYRRIVLARNDSTVTDAEQESFWKCVEIGKHDGLPVPFVTDRLYDIFCMVHKNEDRLSTQK